MPGIGVSTLRNVTSPGFIWEVSQASEDLSGAYSSDCAAPYCAVTSPWSSGPRQTAFSEGDVSTLAWDSNGDGIRIPLLVATGTCDLSLPLSPQFRSFRL